jgi:hypothetical protein
MWSNLPKVITSIVLGLVGAAVAHAQPEPRPQVSLTISGGCPSPEAVASGLSRWVDVVDPSPRAWRLVTTRSSTGSTMRLFGPGTEGVSIERTVESDDCDALAETFVYVVQARFVELAMLPPEALDAPTPEPSPTANPATEAEGETDAEIEPAAETTVETEAESESADEEMMVDRPQEPAARRMSVHLSGGAQLAIEPTALAPSLAAGVGVWLGDFVIRAAGSFAFPTVQRAGIEELEMTTTTGRLEVGGRLSSEVLWLEAAGGVGAGVFSVTARSLTGDPSVLRVRPLARASLALGLPADSAIAVRAELGVSLLPFGDSYVIRPTGEVGRSPVVLSTASLGIQADLFW